MNNGIRAALPRAYAIYLIDDVERARSSLGPMLDLLASHGMTATIGHAGTPIFKAIRP